MRWAGVMSGSSTRGSRRADCRDTVRGSEEKSNQSIELRGRCRKFYQVNSLITKSTHSQTISYLPTQPRPSHPAFPESLIYPLPLHHNTTTTTTITDLTKQAERRLPRLTLLLRHDNRRIKVKVKIHLRKRIRKRWEWHLTPW